MLLGPYVKNPSGWFGRNRL